MHTHFFSATAAVGTFLSVLVVGTFWRVAAAHLAQSNSPLIAGLGRAASVQY